MLVVDDSVVIRRFISRALTADPAFEVIGFAANGSAALTQAHELQPDAITLDIEMPEMDGLATVRALRGRGSKAVIIMCSSLTSHGAQSTIESLLRGANDYVTKPANSDSVDAALETLRQDLLPKIKQFFLPSQSSKSNAAKSPSPTRILPNSTGAYAPERSALKDVRTYPPVFTREQRRIVAIGVSTGGPTALMQILPELPANFPLPILIVQHMPPVFTRQLAERLNQECALEVREAAEGMKLRPGCALIAPGDYHMRLKRAGDAVSVVLDQGERENSCRPAVDVLFRSVLDAYGGQALGVILTGMGQDGLRGIEKLKEKGAYTIAQDQDSSVVWGMPGAVVEAGLADTVMSLKEVASTIIRQVPNK